MSSALTSEGESTVAGDIPANARSFARHLRAANKSPNTTKASLDAVSHLDGFLRSHDAMPLASDQSWRGSVEQRLVRYATWER